MSDNQWFEFLAPCGGTLMVSTCGTATYDTRMAAYTGECTKLTLLACSDNTPGCALRTSIMSFEVEEGLTYLIRVGTASAEHSVGGTMTLSMQCKTAADLDGDGDVDGIDLGILLAAWTI